MDREYYLKLRALKLFEQRCELEREYQRVATTGHERNKPLYKQKENPTKQRAEYEERYRQIKNEMKLVCDELEEIRLTASSKNGLEFEKYGYTFAVIGNVSQYVRQFDRGLVQ